MHTFVLFVYLVGFVVKIIRILIYVLLLKKQLKNLVLEFGSTRAIFLNQTTITVKWCKHRVYQNNSIDPQSFITEYFIFGKFLSHSNILANCHKGILCIKLDELRFCVCCSWCKNVKCVASLVISREYQFEVLEVSLHLSSYLAFSITSIIQSKLIGVCCCLCSCISLGILFAELVIRNLRFWNILVFFVFYEWRPHLTVMPISSIISSQKQWIELLMSELHMQFIMLVWIQIILRFHKKINTIFCNLIKTAISHCYLY